AIGLEMTGVVPGAKVDAAHSCEQSSDGGDRLIRVVLTMPPGDAARYRGRVEVPFAVEEHRLVRPALCTRAESLSQVFDQHPLPGRVFHDRLVARGGDVHDRPDARERIRNDLLALRRAQR